MSTPNNKPKCPAPRVLCSSACPAQSVHPPHNRTSQVVEQWMDVNDCKGCSNSSGQLQARRACTAAFATGALTCAPHPRRQVLSRITPRACSPPLAFEGSPLPHAGAALGARPSAPEGRGGKSALLATSATLCSTKQQPFRGQSTLLYTPGAKVGAKVL